MVLENRNKNGGESVVEREFSREKTTALCIMCKDVYVLNIDITISIISNNYAFLCAYTFLLRACVHAYYKI